MKYFYYVGVAIAVFLIGYNLGLKSSNDSEFARGVYSGATVLSVAYVCDRPLTEISLLAEAHILAGSKHPLEGLRGIPKRGNE